MRRVRTSTASRSAVTPRSNTFIVRMLTSSRGALPEWRVTLIRRKTALLVVDDPDPRTRDPRSSRERTVGVDTKASGPRPEKGGHCASGSWSFAWASRSSVGSFRLSASGPPGLCTGPRGLGAMRERIGHVILWQRASRSRLGAKDDAPQQGAIVRLDGQLLVYRCFTPAGKYSGCASGKRSTTGVRRSSGA